MGKTILTSVLTALAISQSALADDGVLVSAAITPDDQFRAETNYLRHVETQYLPIAGSHDNLASIVNGLRTGGMITLQSRATPPGTPATITSFDVPTRPMGFGNITHVLNYATRDLAAAGITSPTPHQLRAALLGGTVVSATGKITTLPGVLQLRSQGMGWGQIAHSLGISPSPHSQSGTFEKGNPSGTSFASTKSKSSIPEKLDDGIVSAGGAHSLIHGGEHSGIVSANGTSIGSSSMGIHASHSAVVLASGNSVSGGIINANASGHGNAFGKGKN